MCVTQTVRFSKSIYLLKTSNLVKRSENAFHTMISGQIRKLFTFKTSKYYKLVYTN